MDQSVTAPQTLTARYAGTARDLYPLFLGTLALTLLTLGIYRFWARTRIRQHVWSRIEILDEGLDYTGTGKELFIGFLKAMLVITPVLIGFGVFDLLAQGDEDLSIVAHSIRIVLYVISLFLVFVGSYAATRYRLSRTRWRSIRFRQDGSPWRFGAIALGNLILRFVTLGLYGPFMDTRLMRFEAEHRYFGTARFRFDGDARALFKAFLPCWLLLPFTLGMSHFFYKARRLRAFAAATTLDGLRFEVSPQVNGWRLMRLDIGNLFISLFTLGLGYPVVLRRSMRFWCDNIVATGTIDFAQIGQTAGMTGSGEGLAGFLNMDTLGA